MLKQIDNIKKKKQKVIVQKKAELKREYDAIMEDAKKLSAARLMMKTAAYKAKQDRLQERYMRWGGKMQKWRYYAMQQQKQLSHRASRLLGVFRAKLQAKIETLALTKGYSLVVDRSAVWYAKKTKDITHAVIRLVDGR